jgi:carboxymethylenebutenolidase
MKVPAYETILKRIKVENTAYTYPGVNLWFHNKYKARYDEAADIIMDTNNFFKEKN